MLFFFSFKNEQTATITIRHHTDYLSSRTYSRHVCAWLLNPACRMPDHSSRAFDMLPQNLACQSNQMHPINW